MWGTNLILQLLDPGCNGGFRELTGDAVAGYGRIVAYSVVDGIVRGASVSPRLRGSSDIANKAGGL